MLTLTRGLPGLDALQPLAAGVEDEPAPQPQPHGPPPVINSYLPNVERYRQTAWDEMPASVRARPDASLQLDKFLHTMTYESGGESKSALEPGSDGATGVMRIQNLPGRPSPQALMDPTTNIRYAWGLIEPHPDVWTDYGEGGATFNGQPFGALSVHPYGGALASHLSTGQTAFPGPSIPTPQTQPYTARSPFLDNPPDWLADESRSGYAPAGSYVPPWEPGNYGDVPVDVPSYTEPQVVTSGAEQQMVQPQLETAVNQAQQREQQRRAFESVTAQVAGGGLPGLERATRIADIPYADKGATFIGKAVDASSAAAPFNLGAETANAVSNRVVGRDVAPTAGAIAKTLVPTNVRDAALTAAPFAGDLGKAGKFLDRALELASPETRFGVQELASGTGGGGNRLAREMYDALRTQGVTDDEIRAAFGQSAIDAGRGGVDTEAQREATRLAGNDAASHAAKRVYTNTIDAGGSLDEASQAAKEAAAQASEGIAGQVKPNVLADEATASDMATAMSRARTGTEAAPAAGESATETIGGGKTLSASPEGTPATGTTTTAPPSVTTTTSEEDLFKQARDEAVARMAEQRGVSPDELSFTDRAKAVSEVVQRLAKAKPGASVEDILGRAKKAERVADATKAAINPPQQASLADALEMTKGAKFTPPTDNPNASQLTMGGQGGQMGVSEAGPAYTGPKPPEGASLNTQRLNRGLTEPTYQGEGASIPPPKSPGVNAQSEFGKDFTPGPAYKETAVHRAYREVVSLINAPISLVTYGHEPIFRQGIGFALSHPSAAREALGNMVRVIRNPEAAAALNEALNAKPWVKAAMDAGWFHEGERPAETFVNRVLNKIPGMQNSRESARLYLTTLRKVGYEQEAQRLWQMGVKDPEEYRSLWNTVSDVTGHGLRGKSLAVGGINPVFSPQALLGRFRGLIDPFLERGAFNPLSPGARSVAIRNLLGVGGMAAAVEGVATASGLDLKWDLMDTPLGKVSVGPSAIDPTAGYGSIVRLGARAADAVASGDPSMVRDAVAAFANGQLGPVAGTVWATLTGTDWQGKDFNLLKQVTADPTKSGSLARQLLVPIAANAIIDAVKANGPLGALIAAPSMGAMGVETNLLTAERDKAAARLSNGKVTTYEEAKNQPLLKQQIDKDAAVIEAKGSPSRYQQDSDAAYAPVKAEVASQEALFDKGQNARKLRDVYHDATEQNLAHAQDLSRQYADQFKSVPQSKQQALLKQYRDIAPKVAAGEPGAGVDVDFDAQASARKDFVAKLPQDQQDFINQSLQATERNKTPRHQEYDRMIDDKKQAGYFDIKPDDPKAAEKRRALDIAHPDLDVASWRFGSVAGKSGGSLQTQQAVDMALATPDAQNKEVKFQNVPRAINQNAGSLQMWLDSKRLVAWYEDSLVNGQDALNEGKRLAALHGDKEYAKPLAEMDGRHRGVITGNLHDAALQGNPELEAYLYEWGVLDNVRTQAGSDRAGQFYKKYTLDTIKAPKKAA